MPGASPRFSSRRSPCASSTAALRYYAELAAKDSNPHRVTNIHDLLRLTEEGDATAIAAVTRQATYLGRGLRLVAVHLEPFLPGPAARILEQLGVPADAERPYGERVRWGGLPPGTRTAAPSPVFPRSEANTVTVDRTP